MNGNDSKKNNKSKWDNTGLFLLERLGLAPSTSPSREMDKTKQNVQNANIVFRLFSLNSDFPKTCHLTGIAEELL